MISGRYLFFPLTYFNHFFLFFENFIYENCVYIITPSNSSYFSILLYKLVISYYLLLFIYIYTYMQKFINTTCWEYLVLLIFVYGWLLEMAKLLGTCLLRRKLYENSPIHIDMSLVLSLFKSFFLRQPYWWDILRTTLLLHIEDSISQNMYWETFSSVLQPQVRWLMLL